MTPDQKRLYDGLRFRIMEEIERGKNVPLSSMEIAQRLCAGEFSGELLDYVFSRVTHSCHAMVNKGQLVRSDARDGDGRLTYQLPLRTPFSTPKPDAPAPANPVLSKEIAAMITTETKKPKKGNAPPVYADGIMNEIVSTIEASGRALSTRDVMERVAHLYPREIAESDRFLFIISSNLGYLVKSGRLMRAKGNHIKGKPFLHFTKKMGKSSALPDEQRQVAETKPTPATLVKQVEVQPTIVQPRIVDRAPAVSTPEPVVAATQDERPVSRPALFRPVAKPQPAKQLVKLDYTENELKALDAAATKFGVSVEDFCKQAIDFALQHTE